ncbi:hypothetical protein M9Y10_038583 [Tritrichomonas musculus]|uniref:Uncharacterized protein n=1 Tax=Tritrichomonas musculus TaxID=1915356 RepID=A0ABR2K8S1_9EUKA
MESFPFNGNNEPDPFNFTDTPTPYLGNKDAEEFINYDFNDNAALYIYNQYQNQDIQVSSQPIMSNEKPTTILFHSVQSMRQYIESHSISLDNYVLVIPAQRYRANRYDRRPTHTNNVEIVMVKTDNK